MVGKFTKYQYLDYLLFTKNNVYFSDTSGGIIILWGIGAFKQYTPVVIVVMPVILRILRY